MSIIRSVEKVAIFFLIAVFLFCEKYDLKTLNVRHFSRKESVKSNTNLTLWLDLNLLASTHKLQYSVLGRRHFILVGLQRGGTGNRQIGVNDAAGWLMGCVISESGETGRRRVMCLLFGRIVGGGMNWSQRPGCPGLLLQLWISHARALRRVDQRVRLSDDVNPQTHKRLSKLGMRLDHLIKFVIGILNSLHREKAAKQRPTSLLIYSYIRTFVTWCQNCWQVQLESGMYSFKLLR